MSGAPAEWTEQALLFQWAEHATGRYPELALLYAIPNAGGFAGGFKSNMLRVVRLKKTGVKKGVPDICLPVPRGQYHALYLELKAEKGRASPEQKAWLERLREQGNCAYLAHGWEDARHLITSYLTLSPAPHHA